MATAAVEFDLGPLSWVQAEIDHALALGIEGLATFAVSGEDRTALKHARNHIHQAAGAIRMVGLDAVVAFTDEVERGLTQLDENAAPDRAAACATLDRACRKLRIFLDEVVNGAPPVALVLFPEYDAMQRGRGVDAVAPTDLFYPDLGVRAPEPGVAAAIPAASLASHLIRQRRTYQSGLLSFLRGDPAGARAMRAAAKGIEDATSQASLRTFWWTVGALFDAVAENGLEVGFGVKQLAGRIDLQIRRVAAGSAKVADRLRREVLYFIAIAMPVAPTVQAVQQAFRLAGLIPAPEVLNSDVVRLQPVLREARERLAAAKDTWLKVTSGRAENLPKLKEMLASVHANAVDVGNEALTRLIASLAARLDGIAPAVEVPELFAMEYATGMLLAESAVENYASLSKEFPKQVDAMLARLDAALTEQPVAGSAAPLLDEMAKRAQERVLLAQVGREIQANLRHMEQVLDAFFRDHGKRAELATLNRDSQQIRGALRMLGLDAAERLLGLCQAQIETYANPATPVDDVDLELLAESLSGLGFYVEAVEQQRPERERLIAPLLAKRLGETLPVEAAAGDTVEAAVEELRNALPALVAEVHRAPADAAARDLLKTRLGDLRDDAKLIDDGELIAQTEDALRELEAGSTTALEAAVTAITDAAAPTPTPALSDETQRLLTHEATGLDAELLDIYLAEAAEVLDTIVAQHGALQANFGDREALRTVRRQFHTLKGSGRMVGLTELGEIAYDVEKIHNRLLEEERPVTPAVLAMIAVAEHDFRHWVTELANAGRVHADPAALHAAIREVEAELPGNRESVLARHADNAATVPVVQASADDAIAQTPPPVELPELGSTPEFHAPLVDAANADDADMLEEIEVGPVTEPIVLEAKSDLVVADETVAEEAVVLQVSVDEVSVEAAGADEAGGFATDADEVVVGDVSVAADLYAILMDEAEGHLATLAHELSLLQSDPQHEPSAALVRASHTLCGIHRTGGFPLVATTAKSLEQCLLVLPELTPAMREPALPVLARAVRCVTELVGRVRSREGFTPEDTSEATQVGCDLEALRLQVIATRKPINTQMQAAFEEAFATRDEVVVADVSVHDAEEEPAATDELALEAQNEFVVVDEFELEVREEAAPDDELALEADEPGVVTAESGLVAQWEAPPVNLPDSAVDASLVSAVAEAAAPVCEATEPDVQATDNSNASPWAALADIRDEIDAQVLPIFLEEAAELFPRAGDELRAWRRAPDDTAIANRLRRTLHTFKGSARMAGAMRLGELTHLMESRFVADDTFVAGTMDLFEALDTDLDHIAYVLDALREGRTDVPLPWTAAPLPVDAAPAPEQPPQAASEPATAEEQPLAPEFAGEWVPSFAASPSVEALPTGDPIPETMALAPEAEALPQDATADAPSPADEVPAAATPTVVVPLLAIAPAAPPMPEAIARTNGESGARAMLRVRADVIDRLANEAGEVAIARARLEGELRSLKANLLELTASVIRLRTQSREIEIQAESQIQSRMSQPGGATEGFDPLEFDRFTRFQELTRSLVEGVNDVSTVQQALLKNLDDADAALAVQARLSRDVQQQLFAIRTVPFGSMAERLYRILRATAKELDKRANLDIRGGQTELDRSVLEKLAGPLEHLLRNAVDHGIESRDERARYGKPRIGEITLTARQSGNEIVIELSDDGAGLNLDEIRAKGVAIGRFAPDARPTDAQLIECIFEPGFSTATRVTQVSGRGIGMDVVRAEIHALGGRIEVTARPGQGTTFTLYLPLTLAVAQAVLVRAAGRLWALPGPMVEQVLQVSAEELADRYAARCVERQGERYALHYLPRLLGDAHSTPEVARHNPVLLLRAGTNLAAVHVDEMVGNQEVVVKNIGPQLARVSGIAGATVLGTGEIVLIINAVQLAQRADLPSFDETAVRVVPATGEGQPRPGRPLVMIVDDSLTVRKITSRLLAREGFKVTAAKDGVEALELLEAELPDAILLDIEMPRMDGFEFTKSIKRESKTARIPIVMITSRIAEKHRNRAMELGVDRYLGKPYQEEELLRHLRELLAVTV